MCPLGEHLTDTGILTDVVLWQSESFQQVQPVGDMAQLGLVRLLQAEQDQVNRRVVIGCKVVIAAVIDRVSRKLPYAEVPHACGEEEPGKHAASPCVGRTVKASYSYCGCWRAGCRWPLWPVHLLWTERCGRGRRPPGLLWSGLAQTSCCGSARSHSHSQGTDWKCSPRLNLNKKTQV